MNPWYSRRVFVCVSLVCYKHLTVPGYILSCRQTSLVYNCMLVSLSLSHSRSHLPPSTSPHHIITLTFCLTLSLSTLPQYSPPPILPSPLPPHPSSPSPLTLNHPLLLLFLLSRSLSNSLPISSISPFTISSNYILFLSIALSLPISPPPFSSPSHLLPPPTPHYYEFLP